jgi:hypothetical protein
VNPPDPHLTIATLLQTSVSLAGLLLVFVGFIYARADQFESAKRADTYRNLARGAVLPLVPAMLCAWMCVSYLQGHVSAYGPAIVCFQISLILTAFYAFVALFMYL